MLIVTSGSMGDVAPYTGLGVRLRDAGHEVTVATHAPFAPVFAAAGLPFEPMPGDLRRDPPAGAGPGRPELRYGSPRARPAAADRPPADRGTRRRHHRGRREDPPRGDPAVHCGRAAGLPGGRGRGRTVGRGLPAARRTDRRLRLGAARRPVDRAPATGGDRRGQYREPVLYAGPVQALGLLPHQPTAAAHLAGRRPCRLQHRGGAPAADWRPSSRWSAGAGAPDVAASRRLGRRAQLLAGRGVRACWRPSAGRACGRVRRAGPPGLLLRTVAWRRRLASPDGRGGASRRGGHDGGGAAAGVPAVAVPVLADQPFWAGRLHALGARPRRSRVPPDRGTSRRPWRTSNPHRTGQAAARLARGRRHAILTVVPRGNAGRPGTHRRGPHGELSYRLSIATNSRSGEPV